MYRHAVVFYTSKRYLHVVLQCLVHTCFVLGMESYAILPDVRTGWSMFVSVCGKGMEMLMFLR